MLENNFGRFSGDRADFSDITVRMPRIARGTGGTGGKSVVEEELRAPVETDLSEGLGEVIASSGGMSTGFSSFVAGKGERSMTNQDVLPERNIPSSEKIDIKPVTDGETNLYTKAQVAEMVRNAVNIATRGAAQPDMNEVIAEEVKKAVALVISQVKSVETSNVKRTADDNKVMDKEIPESRRARLTKKAKNYQDEYVEMSGGSIGLVQGDDDTGMIQVDFLTNVGGEWTWANNMEIVPKEEVKRTLNWDEIKALNIKDARKKVAVGDTPKEERVNSEKDGFGGGDGQSGGDTGKVVDPVGAMPGEKVREAKIKDSSIWQGPEGWNVKATFDSEEQARQAFTTMFSGYAGSELETPIEGSKKKADIVDDALALQPGNVVEWQEEDSDPEVGPTGDISTTDGVVKSVNGDLVTVIRMDNEKEQVLERRLLTRTAVDNGPSDADVQAKAYEMFKESWDALSSEQMDQVYKALGVKEGHKKVAQIQSLEELKERDFEITDPEMVEMDLDDLQQAVDNPDDYDLRDFEIANIEKRIRMGSTQRALEDAQKVGEDEDPIEEVIRKKEGRMEVANVDYTRGIKLADTDLQVGDEVEEVGNKNWSDYGKIIAVNSDGTYDIQQRGGAIYRGVAPDMVKKTAASTVWTGEGKPTKDPKKPGGVIDNTVKEETAINEHQARRRALRMARKPKPYDPTKGIGPEFAPAAAPGESQDELIVRDLKNLINEGFEETEIVEDMVETYGLSAVDAKSRYDLAKMGNRKEVIQVADSKEVGRQIRDKKKEFQAPKDGVDTVVRPVEKFVGKDTSSKVERAVTDRATGDTVFGTDKPDEMKEKKRTRRQKRKTGTLLKTSQELWWKNEDEIDGVAVGPIWLDGVEQDEWLTKPEAMELAKEKGLKFSEASKKVADISDITEEDFQAYEDVRSSGVTNMWAVDVVEEISGLPREKIMKIMKEYGKLMEKYPNVRQAKKASLAVGDMVSVFSEEEEDYNGQKGEVTEVKPGGTPESVRYMVKMPNGDEVDFGADNVIKVGVDETPDEEIESGAPKVSMRKKEKIAVLKSELAKLLELANFYDENGLVEEASKLDVVREQRMAQLKKAEEEPETDEDVIEKKEAYFTNCHKGDEGWFE